MIWSVLLLIAVTAERLGELVLAHRNTKTLLQQGAVEIAPGHYPLIVMLHTLWLAVIWFYGFDTPLQAFWVFAFALLQVLRIWTLGTLGRRWTTRIIVQNNIPLVKTGPYRFVSHPNYIIVIGEIAILPLCYNMPVCALIFSVLNAVVLAIRISEERRALVKAVHGQIRLD